jgi:hypothetical protein
VRTRTSRRAARRLGVTAVGVVTTTVLAGCSASSCDELPALQAEREQRRVAYLELAESGASPEETGRADEELHEFERRVYDIERRCAQR